MSHLRGNIHQLTVDQGSTVHQVFGVKSSARRVISLTGYTARMQVRQFNRETRDPGTTVVAEYTTGNGRLTVNELAGSITLLIPPAQTQLLSPGAYVYDLEVESPEGETTRIIQGRFVVRAEVTR